jgi:hypothetical protein
MILDEKGRGTQLRLVRQGRSAGFYQVTGLTFDDGEFTKASLQTFVQ